GRLTLTGARFSSEDALRSAIERIVTPLGRRIDESTPMVDARLKDGSRVNAIIPPLALRGPCLTIRKFSSKKLTVDDLIGFGSIDARMSRFLTRAVIARRNILVSGGTGSGKTTLLNILSSAIPEDEQIANSIHVVVQQQRFVDGSRKITSIAEVIGMDDDGMVHLEPIFEFHRTASERGKVKGEFRATGYMPSFIAEFITMGLVTDGE